MTDEKTCNDCAKFRTPTWIKYGLGICAEGMFGDCEASDPNEEACKYFKSEKGIEE